MVHTTDREQALDDELPTLHPEDWEVLLDAIRRGKCTPFLGAGACDGVIPLAAEIAEAWATQHHYPLEDRRNLAQVAQFIATKFNSPLYPKRQMADLLDRAGQPDFSQPDEPHAALAELPLPVYITTNYDDLMFRALHRREPQLDICRWTSSLRREPSRLARGFQPTVERPLVFHLHGWRGKPESIVLTEDDYLDFLLNLYRLDIIPARIQRAMSGSSLLFLGYRLTDWDFRVLFRSLVSYTEISTSSSHVSVQLIPASPDAQLAQRREIRQYLDRYFGKMLIRVYWGSCRSFVAELKNRWHEFQAR